MDSMAVHAKDGAEDAQTIVQLYAFSAFSGVLAFFSFLERPGFLGTRPSQ